MGDELTKDEVAKALYSLAASDGYAELGRQRVVASHEALRASRDDRDRLLSAANKDRKRIVGIFQEAIGALVANGLDVTEILGRELEEQVHDIVELGQPAKGDTRDELRTSLAASLLEVERLKEDAKYINRVQCECVRARDNADRERDAALARTESAERDSAALRGCWGKCLWSLARRTTWKRTGPT